MKDIPLDAPPSYSSASMTAVPYTMPNSSPGNDSMHHSVCM